MKPVNRHLLISLPMEESEEEARTFLLPENYKKKEIERHTLVKIIDVSDDCEKFHQYHINKMCVVEASMINEINAQGCTYSVIAENYVVLVEG